MPDSTIVVETITENSETWEMISRLIFVVLIIPAVTALKKYTKLFWIIDPTDFKMVVLFLTMWGISSALGSDMGLEQIFDKACAMLGLAAVLYRRGKNGRGVLTLRGRRRTP